MVALKVCWKDDTKVVKMVDLRDHQLVERMAVMKDY